MKRILLIKKIIYLIIYSITITAQNDKQINIQNDTIFLDGKEIRLFNPFEEIQQILSTSSDISFSQTTAIVSSSNDIIFSYDNVGNRISRTIYLGGARSSEYANESNIYSENFKNSKVTIYPNPTKGLLQIHINGDLNNRNESFMKVYTPSGRMIYNQKIENNLIDVDLTNYSADVYLLIIYIDNESLVWKIVKE